MVVTAEDLERVWLAADEPTRIVFDGMVGVGAMAGIHALSHLGYLTQSQVDHLVENESEYSALLGMVITSAHSMHDDPGCRMRGWVALAEDYRE